MGKSLKGKELGTGISQRKDGRFSARFVTSTGKRVEKYFPYVQEARSWLAEARLKDLQGFDQMAFCFGMTVDSWYQFWIKNIKEKTVRPNTVRNYRERYKNNIKKRIGRMLIHEVKPMHCQMVLNDMVENYAGSTIRQCLIALYNMFQCAEENNIIESNPVTKQVKVPKPIEKKTKVLTKEDQVKFFLAAKTSANYPQYLFILQTGVRTGEMVGLKWEDLDFENGMIHIRRSMEYRKECGGWKVGPTKTKSGIRDIPMTDVCRNLLMEIKAQNELGKYVKPEYEEFVFINRNGEPTKNSTYDANILKITSSIGIENFSMHTLRHTFATRCIEAGMRPKTLQQLLGHSHINVTMNLYVHVTYDEKKKEMKKFEEYAV